MTEQQSTVPWAGQESWAEMVGSIAATISDLGPEAATLKSLAKQIVYEYNALDEVMEGLCLRSCPGCLDVCCNRATVWYDLKDLLALYLSSGIFPARQIYRRADNSCCYLSPSGCCLARSERPFICTWYICPEQKMFLREQHDSSLIRAIDRVKRARNQLGKSYLQARSS